MSNWFSHSGDLGDVIYSLPTIRKAGGGVLYLFNSPGKTTHVMTKERVEVIRPLLLQQPYIEDVKFWEEHEAQDHSLNGFRNHWAVDRNLADMHLGTHGFDWTGRQESWLQVDYPVGQFPVIFARSPRYHGWGSLWPEVYARYRDKAAFIGLESEYQEFAKLIGPCTFARVSNFLEVARFIKGSKLFVGNQSAPAAIAEGLKVRMILEVCPWCANCNFNRFGRINYDRERLELPDVS